MYICSPICKLGMKIVFAIILSAFAIGFTYPQNVSLERGKVVTATDSTSAMKVDASRVVLSLPDSLVASLITCSPGSEAYTMFGHTALRLRNCRSIEDDLVFNYGVFDYNSHNFIFRFVKGETDYTLAAEPTAEFINRYTMRGFTVWEQELNLSQEQLLNLRELLATNYLPENRVYRYNFLYDNCATRAHEMLERAVGGDNLVYEQGEIVSLTFRDMLHQFTKDSPWLGFGIDMVLGEEVDRIALARQQLFLPSYCKKSLDRTQVRLSENELAPIVRNTITYQPQGDMEQIRSFPISPMQVGLILLVLTIVVSIVDVLRRRCLVWYDVILYVIQGSAGIVVTFLFFFSEHPAVGSNWLVLAFNPLVYVLILDVIRKRKKGKNLISIGNISLLQCVNMAVLLFTILLFWLPLQWIHPALLPMVFSLFIRCLLHLVLERTSDRRRVRYS